MAIRNGMWVRIKAADKERTGIVQSPNMETGECEVHLVDDDGTTALVLKGVPMLELRQAKRSEIPEPRRPDDIKSRKFGYL